MTFPTRWLRAVFFLLAVSACHAGPAPEDATRRAGQREPFVITRAMLSGAGGLLPADGSFPLDLTASLTTREPLARNAELAFALRHNGKEIARRVAPTEESEQSSTVRSMTFSVDAPGEYTVEIAIDGQVVRQTEASVGAVPALGGARLIQIVSHERLRFGIPSTSRPSVNPSGPSELWLELSDWQPLDDLRPYRIEWRHDGVLVDAKDAVYPDIQTHNGLLTYVEYSETAISPPFLLWKHRALTLRAPTAVPAGVWEVRYYDQAGAFSARLDLRGTDPFMPGTRESEFSYAACERIPIATPPDIAKALAAMPIPARVPTSAPLQASASELRALGRSPALNAERRALNVAVNPRRSGQLLAYARLAHESPEEYFRRGEATRSAADRAVLADNQKRAKPAAALIAPVEKHIDALSQPWSPAEHPTADAR